jgi:hypothetical protein
MTSRVCHLLDSTSFARHHRASAQLAAFCVIALCCLASCSGHEPSDLLEDAGPADTNAGPKILPIAPRERIVDIALDSTAVYCLTPSELWAAPFEGEPQLLTSGETNALQLALDEHFIYWLSQGPVLPDGTAPEGTIRRVARGGGTPVTLVDKQIRVGGFAVDERGIFWMADVREADPNLIWRRLRMWYFELERIGDLMVGPEGGPIAAHQGDIVLALEFANEPGLKRIEAFVLWGRDGAETLGTTHRVVSSVAVQARTAFWAESNSGTAGDTNADGRIFASPVYRPSSSIIEPTLLADAQPRPARVVASKNEVFWSNLGGAPSVGSRHSGGIWSVFKDGRAPLPIAGGRAAAGPLAVDDDHIAWLEWLEGNHNSPGVLVQKRVIR